MGGGSTADIAVIVITVMRVCLVRKRRNEWRRKRRHLSISTMDARPETGEELVQNAATSERRSQAYCFRPGVHGEWLIIAWGSTFCPRSHDDDVLPRGPFPLSTHNYGDEKVFRG